MQFTSTVITGSGRGKSIGFPTLNLDMSNVPKEMEQGVYACTVEIDATKYPAAMHYGARPTTKDTPSCEVHVIDEQIDNPPESVSVTVIEKLRDIEDFGSLDGLQEQLQRDIIQARAILSSS